MASILNLFIAVNFYSCDEGEAGARVFVRNSMKGAVRAMRKHYRQCGSTAWDVGAVSGVLTTQEGRPGMSWPEVGYAAEMRNGECYFR